MAVTPPDEAARQRARERSDALAKPVGALGRLEELGAWLAACQGMCPPRPPERVRAVILAGDHGVAARGVSAYPSEVTALMVRAFVTGRAAMNVLARQHGATVRVLDIAVDADLSDLGDAVTRFKLRRSCGSIDRVDAITRTEAEQAVRVGRQIAAEEVAAGADLLILGDMGIGNTTPAAALIAASLGLTAEQVAGIGTGLDEAGRTHKAAVIETALRRVGERAVDPLERLAGLGSADLAVGAGFLAGVAEAGVPVLLDGVIAVAEAVLAEDLAPGAMAWFAAGHRSTEPAQAYALDKLGLTPLLDLGMRLGEGSGAMAAVPLLRSAALLLDEMALLGELGEGS